MNKILKGKILYIVLAIIIVAGFFFRLKGIQDNHSFWSDEAFVSAIARNILLGKINLFEGIKTTIYQPLQLIITALSLSFFGLTEFAARMPSVIFGTVGIIFAYLLGSRLSNKYGGLLSSFLYAFSQLNLANATQAKPYTTIQTLLLIILYLIAIIDDKKENVLIHISIILLASAATLFNYTGILMWIPYIVYILITYRKQITINIKKPSIVIFSFIIILLATIIFQVPDMISRLISSSIFNNTTYLRELLWRNYAFITLPAIVGILTVLKKNKIILIGISLYIVSLLSLWTFKQYSHNVRYLVPFFGILFVFFGVFWAEVGEKLFNKKSALVCLIVAVLLFAGGYKVVRKPAVYYNPNADLLGDVQIANYKDAFNFIDTNHTLQNVPIYNDVPDAHLWYEKKLPDAMFTKAYTLHLKTGQSVEYGNSGKIIHTSLAEFQAVIMKNPTGILIVEDWESFLPEDIKQYAKKNLKLEYRVEGLPQANGDNWPIAVYSWGL